MFPLNDAIISFIMPNFLIGSSGSVSVSIANTNLRMPHVMVSNSIPQGCFVLVFRQEVDQTLCCSLNLIVCFEGQGYSCRLHLFSHFMFQISLGVTEGLKVFEHCYLQKRSAVSS